MDKAKIAAIVVALIVGVGAVVVGGKDIPTAIGIAFDKNAASVYCADLLKEQAKKDE